MADLVGFEFFVVLGSGYGRQVVLPSLLDDETEGYLLGDVEVRDRVAASHTRPCGRG
jgi:hypothetical protein